MRRSKNKEGLPHFIWTKNFNIFLHTGAIKDIDGTGLPKILPPIFECYLRKDSHDSLWKENKIDI